MTASPAKWQSPGDREHEEACQDDVTAVAPRSWQLSHANAELCYLALVQVRNRRLLVSLTTPDTHKGGAHRSQREGGSMCDITTWPLYP